MYTYKLAISAQEHDMFVSSHPLSNVFQGSQWAQVKDSWGNERVGFYKDGVLCGVASLLFRSLPLGFTMVYIPRGPIMDFADEKLVAFVFSSLKEIAKTKRGILIKFDPPIYLQSRLVDQEATDSKEAEEAIALFKKLGCRWCGRTDSISETIQPRFQATIYKEDFVGLPIPKKTRKQLRVAENKGATFEIGHLNLLSDFAELMKKTEDRKQIRLRNQDYYEKLLVTCGDDAYITMARLDVEQRYHKQEQALQKAEALKATFTETTREAKVKATLKEIEVLEKELAFLGGYLEKGFTSVPLAATLSINFGDRSENIYAGMDEAFKHYQPALATWYKTAEHAFTAMGITQQNLGGIENRLDGGLYHFKSKFNPRIEELVGEFDIATSPLYGVFNLLYKLRKKLRSRTS